MKQLDIEKQNRQVKKHSAKVQNRMNKKLSKVMLLNDHFSDVLKNTLANGVVRKSTHPLFIFNSKNGKPELIGTSVLIKYSSQKYYLISAYHLIDISIKENSNLYIGSTSTGFIELRGRLSHTKDDPENSDIGALELSPDLVAKHKLGYIDRTMVFLKTDIATGDLFFTNGFPINKNKQTSSLKKGNTFEASDFTYRGSVLSATSTEDNKTNYADVHLKMKFDKKKCFNGNKKINPPALNGMSGGGLWVTIDSLKKNDTYLAGILIEYSKSNKIITFTKSKIISDLINKLN